MSKLNTWLFNPFHYIAGGTALVLGIGLLIITAIWAPFIGITFDGVIHMNIVSYGVINELVRQLIIVMVMTLLLCMAAMALSEKTFRFIDLFGTQMVARWPIQIFSLIVYSIPSVNNALHEMFTITPEGIQINTNNANLGIVTGSNLLGLLFVAWTVVLMYKSFAVSCNVSGGKAIGVFSAMLVLGHFLSMIFIVSLL